MLARKRFMLGALIGAVLLVLAAVYLGKALWYDEVRTLSKMESNGTDAIGIDRGSTPGPENMVSEVDENGNASRKMELDIPVNGNTLEYDVKACIYVDSENEAYLRLDYYKNGASTIKIFDAKAIPELNNVSFDAEGKDREGWRKTCSILLNAKFSKLYLMLGSRSGSEQDSTSLYVYDIEKSQLGTILKNNGRTGAILLSKDSKHIAFSSVEKQDGFEYSYLQVVNCLDDSIVVNRNRTANGELIGVNREIETKHDYVLLSWYSNDVIKIMDIINPKSARELESPGAIKREILYDMADNIFLNTDGSVLNASKASPGGSIPSAGSTTGSTSQAAGGMEDVDPRRQTAGVQDGNKAIKEPAPEKNTQESEPVKILRNFYQKVSGEGGYADALGMLSEDFKIRLCVMKQFGIEEIRKADIDDQSMLLYGAMLKTARLEEIVGEKLEDEEGIVYYYQSFALGEGEPVRLLLKAIVRKEGDAWKLAEISDGIMEVR